MKTNACGVSNWVECGAESAEMSNYYQQLTAGCGGLAESFTKVHGSAS